MSLHEEFRAASKTPGNTARVPWDFYPVTGELAVFAESIPQRLQTALVRLRAGQTQYTFKNDTLKMEFEVPGFLWPRDFDYSMLEKLPGYRRLVEVAADPANDTAFTLGIKGSYNVNGSPSTTFTLLLTPEEPFSKSLVQFNNESRRFASLHIGEKGVPLWAQTRPKPRLSVPSQTST